MNDVIHLLHLHGNNAEPNVVTTMLQQPQHAIAVVSSVLTTDDLEALLQQAFDLVLIDCARYDAALLQTLEAICTSPASPPIILALSVCSVDQAVITMQHGACDVVVTSSERMQALPAIIRDTVQCHRQRQAQTDLERLSRTLEARSQEHTPELAATIQELLEENGKRLGIEQALRESESRLRTIVTNAPVILYTIDAQGIFTIAEGRELGALDLDPGQVVGTSIFDHYADHPDIIENIKRTLKGESVHATCEIAGISFEYWLAPLQNKLGGPDGVIGVLVDSSDRQRMETAMRDSARRYRLISEMTSDYVFEIAVMPDGRREPLWITDAFTYLTGYTIDDIRRPGDLATIVHPDDVGRYHQEIERLLAGHPITIELRVQRKGGTVRWQRLAMRPEADPMIQGGTRWLGAAQDITERKHAEEKLAHAARLKDEFLASMSHELRTPLTAILGQSETLQEQVFGNINPRQQRALHNIEESGRHLLTLINDILDLSKIEAGHITLEYAPISLQSLCQTSLRMVAQAALKKHITVQFNIDSAVSNLEADERRLKQILVNLLSNAVKFTNDGGMVGLEVTGSSDTATVSFTVWDTGIGISPEHQQQLFRPFVQIDSSLARQYNGTGLGLALVARLTELHGGSVQLTSVVDEGSRFTVTLPCQSSIELATLATDDEIVKGVQPLSPSKHVVLIEDAATRAAHLLRHLHDLGVRVSTYAQGKVLPDQIVDLAPDAILLDLNLTEPTAWDILGQLRAHARMHTIPVVAVADETEAPQVLSAGATGALIKPVAPNQLQQALRDIFAGQSACPDSASGEPMIAPGPVILLADDNQNNRDLLREYLEARGYVIVLAQNGQEALQQALRTNPAIVIMDIQMPQMDGLAAIRTLRTIPGHAKTPIIALTALAMPGDRDRCLAAGATDYLSKPVSLKLLAQTISRHLDARAPVAS